MITELQCAYLAEFGHGWVRDFALEMAALLTGEGGLARYPRTK